MLHSNFIYSLSNQLNALNPDLTKNINLLSIDEVSNIITQSKLKVILFEERHIPSILQVANSRNTKQIRFICIGYELNSYDRLTLLNHNIEFTTIDAYSQINLSYFETTSTSASVLVNSN